MSEESQYINEKQAAAYLGLSAKTLQCWRWQNKGPHYFKFGGAVKYTRKGLSQYTEESRRRTRVFDDDVDAREVEEHQLRNKIHAEYKKEKSNV